MESLVFFTALCFGTRILKRASYQRTEYNNENLNDDGIPLYPCKLNAFPVVSFDIADSQI
jgi:hypothetical protein